MCEVHKGECRDTILVPSYWACAWNIMDSTDPTPRPMGVDNTSCHVDNPDHDLPHHDCIAKQTQETGYLEVVDYFVTLFGVGSKHSTKDQGSWRPDAN